MLLDHMHPILSLSCVSNVEVAPKHSILEHNSFSHSIFLQGLSVVVMLEYYSVVGLSNNGEIFSCLVFSYSPILTYVNYGFYSHMHQ